ncbi:MAG: ABC-type transporter, integral rane subunit [Herbinix sp.]|jgi:putative aldouronate transport system permease protein|nr:ABC-type transporter, integral rane subunit [Herbinix sp.]
MVGGKMFFSEKIKRSKGDLMYDGINVLLILLISLVCLYPMLHVLAASFSDPIRIMTHQGPLLKPLGFSLEGYKAVLNNAGIWIGYRNTIMYVIIGTLINMVMTTIGAYVLSRDGFVLKKFFTMFIVFTMYFTGGIIPNFLLIKGLGLVNTPWALMIPNAIGTWNLLVMRTSFKNVPASLTEAASIDGANDLVILWRIMVPVSKATIAVIFLFYAVGHWNSWFDAMIYLPMARNLFPLQLFLREILVTSSDISSADTTIDYIGELVKYASIVVSTLPILCLYPFVQKYFVTGVMLGSVKE